MKFDSIRYSQNSDVTSKYSRANSSNGIQTRNKSASYKNTMYTGHQPQQPRVLKMSQTQPFKSFESYYQQDNAYQQQQINHTENPFSKKQIHGLYNQLLDAKSQPHNNFDKENYIQKENSFKSRLSTDQSQSHSTVSSNSYQNQKIGPHLVPEQSKDNFAKSQINFFANGTNQEYQIYQNILNNVPVATNYTNVIGLTQDERDVIQEVLMVKTEKQKEQMANTMPSFLSKIAIDESYKSSRQMLGMIFKFFLQTGEFEFFIKRLKNAAKTIDRSEKQRNASLGIDQPQNQEKKQAWDYQKYVNDKYNVQSAFASQSEQTQQPKKENQSQYKVAKQNLQDMNSKQVKITDRVMKKKQGGQKDRNMTPELSHRSTQMSIDNNHQDTYFHYLNKNATLNSQPKMIEKPQIVSRPPQQQSLNHQMQAQSHTQKFQAKNEDIIKCEYEIRQSKQSGQPKKVKNKQSEIIINHNYQQMPSMSLIPSILDWQVDEDFNLQLQKVNGPKNVLNSHMQRREGGLTQEPIKAHRTTKGTHSMYNAYLLIEQAIGSSLMKNGKSMVETFCPQNTQQVSTRINYHKSINHY